MAHESPMALFSSESDAEIPWRPLAERMRPQNLGEVRGQYLTRNWSAQSRWVTIPSQLTLTSNPARTSPVKRGKWILENLLGAQNAFFRLAHWGLPPALVFALWLAACMALGMLAWRATAPR